MACKTTKKNHQEKLSKRSLCPWCESSASIKEEVGAAIVAAFFTVTTTVVSEYVLMSYRAHGFVINVQPCFTAAPATTPSNPRTTDTATGIRMKHIEGVMPPASRHAMMIEHAVESIASSAPTGRRHDVYKKSQPTSLR